MLEGQQVTALIPMRGGSKRVKDKNLKMLGGKPLLAWPIETALSLAEVDRVVVSTDDDKIATLSRKYGAEVYIRPAHLASDDALVVDTIHHLQGVFKEEHHECDILLLLEATSPFRCMETIKKCLKRLVFESLDSIATFHLSDINPYRTWKIVSGMPEPLIEQSIPWLPKQSLPDAYILNGVVYAFKIKNLPKNSPGILFGNFAAEIINGDDVIDIDTEKDFLIAEAILESKRNPIIA